MADIFDLSKLDELDIATLEKQLRDIILSCLYENWHDEASMIGDDLVTRIADDALLGIKTPIQSGQGGFNFDLSPYIDPIIHGAGLLVFLWHIFYTILSKSSPHDTSDLNENALSKYKPTQKDEHLHEIPLEEFEDWVRLLARILKDEKNVEPDMAAKLARLFLRVLFFRASNDGR